MRVAFILNPAARSGRARALGPRLLAAATRHDASLHLTERPRHAEALARDLAPTVDRVVAVGGDGTVGEVAGGLLAAENGGATPLGIVPAGTGDDLAQTLRLTRELDAAVSVALGDTLRPLDVLRARWTDPDGTTGERVAANAVGLGFDAAVAAAVPRYKRLGGVAAYLAAVGVTLRDWRRADRAARVWLDDEPIHDDSLFLLSIGNGDRVGGGFRLTPDALPDDGALDVCLVRHMATARALRLLPDAMRGRHTGQPEVTMARGQTLRIEAAGRPVVLHADGEILSSAVSQVVVSVEVSALAVAVGQVV